jgi:uncharacterized protein YunC (DUF1805 family)
MTPMEAGLGELHAQQRVMQFEFGRALGVSYRWPTGQYCAIHCEYGIVACGLYDCSVASRFGMALAIARGTPEHPLFEPEDLLNARIVELSELAARLGIAVGMSGEEALRQMFAAGSAIKD